MLILKRPYQQLCLNIRTQLKNVVIFNKKWYKIKKKIGEEKTKLDKVNSEIYLNHLEKSEWWLKMRNINAS